MEDKESLINNDEEFKKLFQSEENEGKEKEEGEEKEENVHNSEESEDSEHINTVLDKLSDPPPVWIFGCFFRGVG